MASATFPAFKLEPIFNVALTEYTKQTGIDLATCPFADRLFDCSSPDSVIRLLEERAQEFKDFRDRSWKLPKWLHSVVHSVYLVSSVLGNTPDLVVMSPTKAVLVGIYVLLTTAKGVTTSYDALEHLFGCLGSFLNRVRIYANTPLTPSMTDIIVKIMAELLSVLALSTTQIKQGRLKRFGKTLFGEREIEAVLQRLDRLTQEEARMAVAQTLEGVHGLVNNTKMIMDDGEALVESIRRALVALQETTNEMSKMQRDQLQENIRNWLSPPDPSKNHNAARESHHDGTAEWFTQGTIFDEWKETGSLLWIRGKPGSGKTVLCSAIIKALRDTGLALVAYFYCDFRDRAKQDVHGLLTSLLAQLCSESDPFSQILSQLYSRHNAGCQQPDDDTLIQCLKSILQFPQQPTIYLIIDALDECPNTTGIASARERVLKLIEELVRLGLPNLRVFLTSRPEVDICASLDSLMSNTITVSLHEQYGQKKDIEEYVSSVVHSDRNMRKWRAEDKQLVIDTLSEKADGMFRWVYCQLEVLRRCFPATIRRALYDLPGSLDETYQRILLEIDTEKRKYAHRLFQCLAVSVRPLRVQELAEILAIQLDEVYPTYNAHWRPEDPEEAVLSACSSLIAVADVDDSRIVQFSHFSVKEFLTSERLSNAEANLSRFYIHPLAAHTTFARATLSILLDDHASKNGVASSPLAIYAAQHWIDHGQFENVFSCIKDAMVCLFDLTQPYFSRWVSMFDIDHPFREPVVATVPALPEATPLYYATLCGIRDLIELLITAFPFNINARGGYRATPLHAAVAMGNVEITSLLTKHGADVNTLDNEALGPLHLASRRGCLDVLKLLLEHQAAIDILGYDEQTPLYLASHDGELEAARILLQRGAAVDARNKNGWTPLMAASRLGHLDVVRLLIQNGAVVDSKDDEGWTPLQSASRHGHLDIVRELVACNADVNAQNYDLWTGLHLASDSGNLDVAGTLVAYGAAVDVKNKEGETPLDLASGIGELGIAQLLIDRGADVNSRNDYDWTPLHKASWNGHLDVVRQLLLVDSLMDIDIPDKTLRTPLALASHNGQHDISRLLIERGADVNSSDDAGWTPLHWASRYGYLDTARLLLDYSAAVNVEQKMFWTPLHLASANGHLDVADLLIKNGADIDKGNKAQGTPLYWASGGGRLKIVQLLVENGSDTNSQDIRGNTPLHMAARNGHLDVVKLLLERRANVNTRNLIDMAPLDSASSNGKVDVAKLLAEHMEAVDCQGSTGLILVDHTSFSRRFDVMQPTYSTKQEIPISDGGEIVSSHITSQWGDLDVVRSLRDDSAHTGKVRWTPLDLASREGMFEYVKLFIKRGENVNGCDKAGWTPLHKASRFGHFRVVQLLLEHGANVNAEQRRKWTPLHLASYNGHLRIVELLLEKGGNVQAKNEAGRTPSQEAVRGGEREIAQFLTKHDRRGM